jgi:hypothetical protein
MKLPTNIIEHLTSIQGLTAEGRKMAGRPKLFYLFYASGLP